MALYLRDLPGSTLRDLADEVTIDSRSWGGVTNEMNVRQEAEGLTFSFGPHEVPGTRDGLDQLCTFLGAPRAFIDKLPLDMQEYNLSRLLHNTPANVSVRYDDHGLLEVHKPGQIRVDPGQIVERAINVMGESAALVEWTCTSDELRFDAMVPDGFDRGIGGDPQRGDVTHGGLRFSHNRKLNHAPAVNTFLYRLVCTNGMMVPETGLRLDARGSTVDVLLAELELAARHAFEQVEEQIEHFYSLRSQRIEGDVTQAVIRVARERGLPDRTRMRLAERVPDQLTADVLGHEPTMFDLVNLFTNQANDPALRNRIGSRAQLEVAGGALVRELHDRCGTCHQTLN